MTSDVEQQNSWKQLAGEAAAQRVEQGMLLGLGTGSTANYFISALAQRIQEGLRIVGAVPSSQATADLATSLGIPLTNLDTHPDLDLYIDGADEIDSQLHLLKGAGGALLREKIVATSAQRFIVIADTTKLVQRLAAHFPVPVEVAPFALTPVHRRLTALGATVQLRDRGGKPFITDNNNLIFDCTFPEGIADPPTIDAHMHSIVGVVETGLFLNFTCEALIGGPQGLQHLP